MEGGERWNDDNRDWYAEVKGLEQNAKRLLKEAQRAHRAYERETEGASEQLEDLNGQLAEAQEELDEQRQRLRDLRFVVERLQITVSLAVEESREARKLAKVLSGTAQKAGVLLEKVERNLKAMTTLLSVTEGGEQ